MDGELSNHEVRELVQLMRQRPILPNIVNILWFESCNDETEVAHVQLLLQTFRDTFPDLDLDSYDYESIRRVY
jgi:hypothetical protein